ncbi:hypothetical protein [Neochlamydia sp. S13]|jgi:hypothetical protein|nr:hypothetical protein [Neochlamydia sp. S13]
MIELQIIATQKHATFGGPKAEQKPSISSYRLQGTVACALTS